MQQEKTLSGVVLDQHNDYLNKFIIYWLDYNQEVHYESYDLKDREDFNLLLPFYVDRIYIGAKGYNTREIRCPQSNSSLVITMKKEKIELTTSSKKKALPY